nr:hypothetical protein HAGR004_20140 [Bdellovibrio sp. HAGR004]
MIWLNVLLLSNPVIYFALLVLSIAGFLYLHFRKQTKILKIGFGIIAGLLIIHLIVFWMTMAPKDPL